MACLSPNSGSVPSTQLLPVPAAAPESPDSSFEPRLQSNILSANFQIALHPRSLSWSCGTSQILCCKHFCSHVIDVLIYVSVAQKDAHLWDLALSLVYPVPFILGEQEEINNES